MTLPSETFDAVGAFKRPLSGVCKKKNQNPIFFYEYNTHGSSDVFLADCSLCISFHRTRIRIISPLHGQLSCDTSEWLESHKPCCTQNRQTFPETVRKSHHSLITGAVSSSPSNFQWSSSCGQFSRVIGDLFDS